MIINHVHLPTLQKRLAVGHATRSHYSPFPIPYSRLLQEVY
ncbi:MULTISPECIES: hypothetical protein [unclassified Moorena]|nr:MULTISPECIES: hypothetical protein [unclassified Moorena]